MDFLEPVIEAGLTVVARYVFSEMTEENKVPMRISIEDDNGEELIPDALDLLVPMETLTAMKTLTDDDEASRYLGLDKVEEVK